MSEHEHLPHELAKPKIPPDVPGFANFGHIPLEKVHNCRDLGGMPAADGKFIKVGMLIRSDELHEATTYDLGTLLGTYNLERIVDFRTPEERKSKPDPKVELPGIIFYDFEVFDEEAAGITHANGLLDDLRTLRKIEGDPKDAIIDLYKDALLDDMGQTAFRSFFDVLTESEGGATLWHCTEGKDRTGLGSMLIEHALGVPMEYIRDDYLATNKFVYGNVEKMIDGAWKIHLARGIDETLETMLYANLDYLDAAIGAVNEEYGSLDSYMEEVLGVDDEVKERLRETYLGT